MVLILALVPAQGQQESSPDLTSLSLEDLTQVKVYSASKHLEDSDSAPSAVTIITADDIKRYGWRTLAEALSSVRGFYTSYDREYVYLGVLGVLRPTDYNSRILLLINGHRLNDNVYDSAQIGTEFPLDMDLVERIEVVRGPASSLFGTNALFGVINVITRQPEKEATLEVNGEAQSWMGRFGSAVASLQRGEFSGLISGSLFRSDGHEQLFYPEYDSPQTNNGYAVGLDGDSYSHAFADFQDGHFRLQALYSDRVKELPTAPFHTEFDAPGTSMLDRRAYVDLSYNRPWSANTEFDLSTYFDYYDSLGQGAFSLLGMPAARGYTAGNARWAGSEASLSHQFGKDRITVGGVYEYSFRISQQVGFYDVAPLEDGNRPDWLTAWYAQAELNLLSKLSMNAGVRFDWFDQYGLSTSPRVALVYAINSKTSLKYIFGRAFRAPNAYEEWYSDGVIIESHALPLQPEHIQSQNLMLERRVFTWGEVTAEFFYNNLTNIIDLVTDPTTGLFEFVNDEKYHADGLGLEFDATTRQGLRLRTSYMLAEANYANGAQLANDPVNMIKLNVSAPFSHWTIGGLELQYMSSQLNYLSERVPASVQTNLTISTKPLWNDWQFSASCYNLFNSTWYLPAGPELTIPSIQQDGRSFRVTLSYRLPLGKKASAHE
jgi:outer membrane receptor for ferrienterochelin and colicins